MMSRLMLTLVASTTPLLITACAEDQNAERSAPQTTAQVSDAEFDRMLREALMRRPEVIIDAIEAYRIQMEADAERASLEVLTTLLPDLINAKSGHAVGASVDDAEIVVVEFFDYRCGFCKRALNDVMTLIDDEPSIRVVFQELPILSEESRQASLSAIAAGLLGGPDAYGAVHRELMSTEGAMDQRAIDAAIRRAGSNPRKVADVISERRDEVESKLDQSIGYAQRAGLNGTPYFVFYKPSTDEIQILHGYTPQRFAETLARLSG